MTFRGRHVLLLSILVFVSSASAFAQQNATIDEAISSRIHPHLRWLHDRLTSDHRVRLVVSFTGTEPMPPLPRLDYTLPRSDPKNVQILASVRSVIDTLRIAREAEYAKKLPELSAFGVNLETQFWLINGIVVNAPLSAVEKVAMRNDVAFIEEADTDTPPPTVSAGRAVINSDFLYSVSGTNYSRWVIAILDTGVRLDHVQFVPDNRIVAFDCVNGTADYCRTGSGLNPTDDCWNHGTSTTAILTANSAQGDSHRGVTNYVVRSYKIYPSGCIGLSVDAAVRGFQAAVSDVATVIAAEIQDTGGVAGAIATAANQAFESGIPVIAANGNFGPGAGSVRSPAIAYRVIGVGAVDVNSLATMSYQGRGPTPDGRVKPDVQAPTNTETASNASTTALQIFTGTSCATPYAAAATALLGHWQYGMQTAAGDYYARLINWGSNFTDAATNNDIGAGLLVLPSAFGTQQFPGLLYLSNSSPIADIQYSLPVGAHDFRAAIWWAEGYAGQGHNQMQLYILDPAGSVRAQSTGPGSVFQKARVPGPLDAGVWTLHLVCAVCPSGANVYYDANAQ